MLITVIEGLNGAVETLVSQSYGYGDLHLCGVQFNRGRLILTTVYIPLAILLSFSDTLLIWLGQDDLVVHHASNYIVMTLPAVYFYSMFDLTKRFLNCMNVAWVPMTATVIATILHPFWCYLFVIILGMDITGIAIAYTITQSTLIIFVTVYAACVPEIADAIHLPDADALKEWRSYLRLGIPVMIMLWAEDSGFHALTLLSGLIGVNA